MVENRHIIRTGVNERGRLLTTLGGTGASTLCKYTGLIMIKGFALALMVFSAIALYSQASNHVKATAKADRVPEDLARLISWLPADTETITVARGPFVLASTLGESETKDRTISDKELTRNFEELPLALLRFKDGLLSKRLEGKRVNFALEGARHFRPPAGLGEMPYEGCAIAVFSDNLRNEITSFVQDARKSALRSERIEDQDVSVFKEKLEQNTWTTFIAFPDENVILVASDRTFLAEVLARLDGKVGPRALSSDLPEWKYVNANARFWGLRHYDKSQTQADPSSPYGGRKSANFPDEQAVGLAFVFDPDSGKSATITYLSGNLSIGSKPSDSPLSMASAPEAKGLNIKIHELSPGVLEGSYSLEHLEAVQFFLFALEADLGHAIYL